MSVRVKLTVVNNTGTAVRCVNIGCEKFIDLNLGTTIPNGVAKTFESETNDRIFCTFEQNGPGEGKWQLAMTSPKSSPNSACGSLDAGLQVYDKHGTPAEFTFRLGEANRADWDHGNVNDGVTIPYGECS